MKYFKVSTYLDSRNFHQLFHSVYLESSFRLYMYFYYFVFFKEEGQGDLTLKFDFELHREKPAIKKMDKKKR